MPKQENVGIGTTTPGSKLSVNGNTAIGSTFANSAAPANSASIEGQLSVGTLTPTGIVEFISDNKDPAPVMITISEALEAQKDRDCF